MNEDGSWVVFSCKSGFRLHGPSMLYCKGHIWNSTKPVCKGKNGKLSAVKAIFNIFKNVFSFFTKILLYLPYLLSACVVSQQLLSFNQQESGQNAVVPFKNVFNYFVSSTLWINYTIFIVSKQLSVEESLLIHCYQLQLN